MLINIENPERSLRVLEALREQEYPEKLETGIRSWLEEITIKIVREERIERYRDVWRRIDDFPKYEISGTGLVRRRDADDEEELWVEYNAQNKPYIRLTKNRGTYTIDLNELRNQIFPEIKAEGIL